MPKYMTQEHFDATFAGFDKKFVTKDEFHSELTAFRDEVATRFDEVVTILKRLDQERLFTIEWVRRIESDVSMMKKHLKLA